jgi:hypothetical protein
VSRLELASLGISPVVSETAGALAAINGASVEVKKHGVATKVAIYTANEGATEEANPCKTNARGEIPGFIEESGEQVDLVVTQTNFNPITHTIVAGGNTVRVVAGTTNLAAGTEALKSLTTGEKNTAFGIKAMASANATVKGSTALGYEALGSFTHNANEEGDNVAIGANTGHSLTTGCGHTLVGFNAGARLTTSEECTVVGCEALVQQTTSSGFSTCVGFRALNAQTTGVRNTAMGYQAMEKNTGGESNVAVGHKAGKEMTSSGNVAIGVEALEVSFGAFATAVGFNALKRATSGEENTALGNAAMSKMTTGEGNVALGHHAGNEATGESTGNVFIGRAAGPASEGAISNQLYIHNAKSAEPLIFGNFSERSLRLFNEKLAFFKHAVISQATHHATVTGFVEVGGTAVKSESTFTGNVGAGAYTIGDIVKALKEYGLLTE